ncbi:restriction endonuclease subunit S [Porphyromonas sp. oral taxon 275]|uniref:restriction endonuclease subunit S n=1 Tax=Porphyromonas sp. oral taxon 275 TaxID=712435 RepID=UPI001BA921E3|nr:restriction endonuclease subunit S [Porphyromonas sp. oral taxon 275]QUB42891.1 restriction endonuclease subunit S [Porphyromonas sp. oral taxon 275]
MIKYIEQLLQGQPVVWKPLGEVGVFTRGSGLQKKDLCETGVPAIHYGQIYTYYKASVEKTLSYVTEEVASKLRKVDYGDVIITNTSENIDDVCKALLYLVEEQGVIGGHACTFRPSNQLLGKYLVYYTMTDEFYQQKRKLAKGTKVIDVSATDLAKVVIPIPPLSVQAEIVRILDSFTSLTAELEAELEARRAQYAHYRDELLKFTNRGGGGVK